MLMGDSTCAARHRTERENDLRFYSFTLLLFFLWCENQLDKLPEEGKKKTIDASSQYVSHSHDRPEMNKFPF